jgi:outer membrane protein TolC
MFKFKKMIENSNKIIVLSFLLMLSTSLFSQENLENYLEIAARNNPGLKAKFSDYMAAMEKVPQVGTLPDPTFAFGYFIQPVETRVGPQKWKANISQSFPWFGLLEAKEDVATEMAKSKYEIFENNKSNLFFEVKTSYFNYYFIEKAIQITRDNMEILRIFKRLAFVKIESGNASIVDELRVELELNDLENQLALFIDTKNALQVKFNNLLYQEKSTKIDVPDTLWQDKLPFDKLTLLDSIYSSNHELKSIDHKLNAFLNQEIAAKKEGLPKFNIGFGYVAVNKNLASTASDNGKDAFFPSIGVKIPLYRKKYKALIKEAKYLQEAEISKKEDKKNMLSSVYENTYKDYNDGDRRISLNAKQSKIAKKVLDVLITSYSTNSKDFEEVLRIERQLLKYELAYQRALTDKNAAIAFMYYLIGK